jgi:hypothetical protein
MEPQAAEAQWDLANGGKKSKGGKGKYVSGARGPRPRHFRPNGHLGDQGKQAQRMGDQRKQAQRPNGKHGRRLLSFERDDDCKSFAANSTNVVGARAQGGSSLRAAPRPFLQFREVEGRERREAAQSSFMLHSHSLRASPRLVRHVVAGVRCGGCG